MNKELKFKGLMYDDILTIEDYNGIYIQRKVSQKRKIICINFAIFSYGLLALFFCLLLFKFKKNYVLMRYVLTTYSFGACCD